MLMEHRAREPWGERCKSHSLGLMVLEACPTGEQEPAYDARQRKVSPRPGSGRTGGEKALPQEAGGWAEERLGGAVGGVSIRQTSGQGLDGLRET